MLPLKKLNKPLYKYYKSQLDIVHKSVNAGEADIMDELILRLRLIRDKLIISDTTDDVSEANALKTIAAAINEYDLSKTCILNYYNITNNSIIKLDETKSIEETAQAYNDERMQHISAFWKIATVYMEDWQNYAAI